MKNTGKALLLTTLFMSMFLSILYFISMCHPIAWKYYGIIFGILGVWYFTKLLFRWITCDR